MSQNPTIRGFVDRHIGPNADESAWMLKAVGVESFDDLLQRATGIVAAYTGIAVRLQVAPFDVDLFHVMFPVTGLLQRNPGSPVP